MAKFLQDIFTDNIRGIFLRENVHILHGAEQVTTHYVVPFTFKMLSSIVGHQ